MHCQHCLHSHQSILPEPAIQLSTAVTDMYNLMVECQAIGTKLVNKFQSLSGLKAIHQAVAQTAAHKIFNAGCTAQSEAYVHLPRGNDHEPKHQKTLQQLLTEADKAWKVTNDVVYSH